MGIVNDLKENKLENRPESEESFLTIPYVIIHMAEKVWQNTGADYALFVLPFPGEGLLRAYLATAGNSFAEELSWRNLFPAGNSDSFSYAGLNWQAVWTGLGIEDVMETLTVSFPNNNQEAGCLTVGFADPNGSVSNNKDVLKLIAENGALLLNNARLKSELRETNHNLIIFEEVGNLLASFTKFEDFLGQVIKILEGLTGAESGGILLYDSNRRELVLQKPSFGTADNDLDLYRLPVGELPGTRVGTAVEVFLSGRPYVCNDASVDSTANQEYIRKFKIRNFLTVPLLVNQARIGVLHLVNKKGSDFNERDVRLINTLATQIAIVIKNASLYNQERENVYRLRELNNLSEIRQARLRKMMDIHKQLTLKVLKGDGYQPIAETLTTLVDNPVIVEDAEFTLLAAASYPVGQPSPAALPRHFWNNGEGCEFLENLQERRETVRIPAQPDREPGCQRLVAPVFAGQEVLGYITVLEERRELEEFDLIAIEHAATILALEMMKHKIAFEVEARLRGDFLDDLLQGNYKSEKEIINRAKFFGYDLNSTYQVIILNIDDFSLLARELDDESKVARIKNRLAELIDSWIKESSSFSLVTFKSDTIVILANVADGPGSLSPSDLAAHIRRLVINAMGNITLSAGIGRPAATIAAARESYREARLALDVFKKNGRRNFQVNFDEVGLFRLLFQGVENRELAGFARQMIGPLLEYDRNKGGQLVPTLECYLNNGCNLKNSAKAAFLHMNTLSYRLRRIEEILGVNLDDPEIRLNLQVALKILDFLQSGSEGGIDS